MKHYEALDLPDDAHWITVQVALPPTLDIDDVRDELRGTAFAVREIDPSQQDRGAVERIEELEGALAWALAYIDRPDDVNAEEQENYDGAERVLDGGR